MYHLRKDWCFIRNTKVQVATAGQVRVITGSAAGAAAVKGETVVVCLT